MYLTRIKNFSLLKPSPWQKRISLAFGLVGVVIFSATSIFLWLNRNYINSTDLDYLEPLFSALVFILLATLLTYRRPENRISWLLAVFILLRMTGFLRYVVLIGFAKGLEPSPGLLITANFWPWFSGLTYTLLAFTFILFPDGKLPSRRWRPVYWLTLLQVLFTLGIILSLSLDIVQQFSIAEAQGAEISLVPLMESGPLQLALHVRKVPAIDYGVIFLATNALMHIILGLVSQINRFRRGNPVERQQIKWVIFVMTVWAGLVSSLLFPIGIPLVVFNFFSPLPAIAITLAIFRYRLYDIDIIINRTLVYGSLSAGLLFVYFGSVVVLENLSRNLTGSRSSLATVLATLLIAALFQPLRLRLQNLIDRAFFRKKYDAIKTLETFAGTVRDEVSFEKLSQALLETVEETVQPTHLSLMIRNEPTSKTIKE